MLLKYKQDIAICTRSIVFCLILGAVLQWVNEFEILKSNNITPVAPNLASQRTGYYLLDCYVYVHFLLFGAVLLYGPSFGIVASMLVLYRLCHYYEKPVINVD